MINFIKKYFLSISTATIIIILCFIKTSSLPAPPVENSDKYVHSIMYIGLASIVFFDNTRRFRFAISKLKIFWGTFIFPVSLGGLIELMQAYLTTHRSGDWFDFLFNVIGAFLGMGIALLINRHLSREIR